MVIIGLFGKEIRIPAFASIFNEYRIIGSLWANYNKLREVIELAKKGKIRHHIQKFNLEGINYAIELLSQGTLVGRGVIIP
jgi:alcohol dehydrogenase, propanol-preferring